MWGGPFVRIVGKMADGLAQQLENALRNLVGLGQHGLGGLHQDVVLGVAHHFLGDVGVADGGLGVLDVLGHHGQVVGGVLQTVLGGAQVAADAGHIVNGVADGLPLPANRSNTYLP